MAGNISFLGHFCISKFQGTTFPLTLKKYYIELDFCKTTTTLNVPRKTFRDKLPFSLHPAYACQEELEAFLTIHILLWQ